MFCSDSHFVEDYYPVYTEQNYLNSDLDCDLDRVQKMYPFTRDIQCSVQPSAPHCSLFSHCYTMKLSRSRSFSSIYTIQNFAIQKAIEIVIWIFFLRVNGVYHARRFYTGSRFGLRWFTPTNEVPLCGHATLASAAVLFSAEGKLCIIIISSPEYLSRFRSRLL